MEMDYDDVARAVRTARERVKMGDKIVREVSDLMAGRLRTADIPAHTLKELKRELRDFNIHTGTWKPR